ncbi:MAG: hypothetical protein AAFX94_09005 [Myxococcota bacterium]
MVAPAPFARNATLPSLVPPRGAHPATPRAAYAFAPLPGRAAGPFATDRRDRISQALALLQSNTQWPPANGSTIVIQIDQDSPPASAEPDARSRWLKAYTGETVVFHYARGVLLERAGPFRSAAHPSRSRNPDGAKRTDVGSADGGAPDGVSDVAHLHSGVYRYRRTGKRYSPSTPETIRVARDLNQDGVITQGPEVELAGPGWGIQLHRSRPEGPISAGCQTIHRDDWAAFEEAVGGAEFTYLLARRPHPRFGANPF